MKSGTPLFNILDHGAIGDGHTLDTNAINRAIDAAASSGGGTVWFPAGTYLSFSIRLKSNIGLHLDHGAVLLAADPSVHAGVYDAPEPNEWDMFQDFGHSHWQNSLIWGIGLENVSITGPGLIWGKGLTRRGPGPRRANQDGDAPRSMDGYGNNAGAQAQTRSPIMTMEGQGNKAIALKRCRNVVLRDFSVLEGGHFVVLATGVDHLTVDNLKIDTNRDGLDIDGCRHVRIANCSVNSPNDDAIVFKSSFALGEVRDTEHVTVTNCQVTGYNFGTFLDGRCLRTQERVPDRDGPTGRIKCGTESNGGFKNVTISNCVFDRARGLALETVDGGVIEDVTVSNLTMRDVASSPLFLRLGNRARGPAGTRPGAIRRVTISNVVASGAEHRFASIIAGLPGHPIEDVQLNNIRLSYRGGGTVADAAIDPPENEKSYPDPSMFGTVPAYGLYVRHAKNVTLQRVAMSHDAEEHRPPVVLHDVDGVACVDLSARRSADGPWMALRDVRNLTVRGVDGIEDRRDYSVSSDSI